MSVQPRPVTLTVPEPRSVAPTTPSTPGSLNVPQPDAVHRQQPRDSRAGMLAGAIALAAAVSGGAWWFIAARTPSTGSLRVETDAPGATVTIDGAARGTTPLTLALAPGAHTVVVTQGSVTRTLPLTVTGGSTTIQHISWPPTAARNTGAIEITSDPKGQYVTVDGSPRGATPLTITDLPPGEHEVLVRRDTTTVRRTVVVEAGSTASLMLSSGAAAGVSSGWLSVNVQTPLQILENGKVIGTTESDRILLPVGSHSLEFVSDSLGFRQSRTVTVNPGQTNTVTVALPRGTININAVPWAQVWLDGQPLGDTPIGNVSWTIGTHEVVLRHPELGERKVSATITTREPARVAVDLRRTP